MEKIKEIEVLIEELKYKLANYLNEERPFEDIQKLSEQIDELIVMHYNLVKQK